MNDAVPLFDWADRSSLQQRAPTLPAKKNVFPKRIARDWSRLGVRLAAIWLTSASAYFSVVGMTAVFAAAVWPIVAMAAGLEVAKLATAPWLYRNWQHAPRLLKWPLVAIVVLLVAVTTLGVFGFLSKSHIERQVAAEITVHDQLTAADGHVTIQVHAIADFDRQIAQIDSAVEKLTDRGRSSSAMKMAGELRRRRLELVAARRSEAETLAELQARRAQIEGQRKRHDADFGPILYLAKFVGGEDADVDKAFRILNVIISLVLDPLAVLLWIAANTLNVGSAHRRGGTDLKARWRSHARPQ